MDYPGSHEQWANGYLLHCPRDQHITLILKENRKTLSVLPYSKQMFVWSQMAFDDQKEAVYFH